MLCRVDCFIFFLVWSCWFFPPFLESWVLIAQISLLGDSLAAEAVEGASLALERVDHVHGGDGLALGVLGVGDGVADHVLQEDLEHAAGLLVDEPRDALDAAAPGQAADGGLGDALDVVAQHLAVPLRAALAQAFASLAATRHSS